MQNSKLFSQRIRLRHLYCFVAVAQTRFLNRAAEKLNLSQPALSKTLSELESLTGSRLLERGRQGAQLTPLGELFLNHAVRVLTALDAAGHAIAWQSDMLQATLRVGALPTTALGVMSLAIGRYQQTHPRTHLQLSTMANTALLAQLKAGEIELAIGRIADPDMMTGLTFELLFLESLSLVVNPHHPLLHNAITLKQILSYPAIVSPQGTVPRHNTDAFLTANGFSLPAQCIETLSASLARQLVQQFNYVWFVPSGAVRHDIATGQLAVLPFSVTGTGEPIGILTRQEAVLAPEAQTLIATIREVAQQQRHTSS